MDFNIPLGWSIKSIKDIGKCVTGTTPKTNQPEYYSSADYDFISPADLGNRKYIYNSNKKVSTKGLEVSRPIPKNTVLCVCIGSSIGKVGLSWHKKSCTNQQINSIICNIFFDSQFIYYLLLYYSDYWKSFATFSTVPILNKGRFEEITIPICDDIEEQRRIAGVLSLVQDAIAQQEQLIILTTELKKALMQKLFTEGTRNEPQKMTEIGLIPESWDLLRCSELCQIITVGVVVKPASYYVKSGIPAFRSLNVREDKLVTDNLVYFSPEDNDGKLAKSKVYAGDVLIVRTGYPGTSCVVPEQYEGSNCIDIVIARPKNTISSKFLSRFFNSPSGKLQALSAKHGLAQQHLNVGAVKNVLVPVPASLEEQNEIAKILENIDNRLTIHEYKKYLLTDLFRTLLHQLMTAQIRVDDLNLSALHLEPQGGNE